MKALRDWLRLMGATFDVGDTEDEYMRRRHMLGLSDADPRSAREVEFARRYVREMREA